MPGVLERVGLRRSRFPKPVSQRLGVSLAFVVAAWSWASVSHATVMLEVPLETMSRQADAIVVATVLRSDARLVLDPRRGAEPHTFTELAVHEWIVGGGGERVVLEEIGGDIAGDGLVIAGTPTYAPGEEVVVFLERRDDGSLRTFAMAQGRFLVRRGIGAAPDLVARDLEGIAFASWSNGRMAVGHAGPEAAVALDAFLATVRALVALRSSTPWSAPIGGVR